MSRVRDARVRPDLLYVAGGWSTLVTDVHGRITGTDPEGFYVQNTRVLSRERVRVDGREPAAFSTANVGAHAQLSYAELADGETLPSRAAYLMVERFLGEGLRTRLSVISYADEPLTAELRIEFDADFADTEEAEQGERRQRGGVQARWDPNARELRLRHAHPDLDRAVAIRVEAAAGVRYADRALAVDLAVPSRESAALEFTVEPVFDGRRLAAPPPIYAEPADAAARARDTLAAELTRLRSTNLDLAAAWRTAVTDLAALPLGEPPGPAAPIAGLPIYQQIFGRDTLTVSWHISGSGDGDRGGDPVHVQHHDLRPPAKRFPAKEWIRRRGTDTVAGMAAPSAQNAAGSPFGTRLRQWRQARGSAN